MRPAPHERTRTEHVGALGVLRALFVEGGLATTTALDDAPAIQSLVQADGDVIVTLRADALGHPGFGAAWGSHWTRVRGHLAIIPRLTAWVRIVARGAGAVGVIMTMILVFARGGYVWSVLVLPILLFVAGQASRALVRFGARTVFGKSLER